MLLPNKYYKSILKYNTLIINFGDLVHIVNIGLKNPNKILFKSNQHWLLMIAID